jgi:hypothetical protein
MAEYELMPASSRVSIASQQQTWRQRHLKGWRFGILSGSILAFTVLSANLAFTIYGGIKSTTESATQKLLYQGSCAQVTNTSMIIHLVINLLSTLLLSASNYGMQCLSAPTRREIDIAHSKKEWMDIGVLSIKNLGKISTRRTLLWALLGLSSLPLHLFYNSAVYSSVYSYDYDIFGATEEILQNSSQDFISSNNAGFGGDQTALYMYASYQANNLTRLENADCIKAYAATFQSSHGNVILVFQNLTSPFPYIQTQASTDDDADVISCQTDPYSWICGHSSYRVCLNEYPVCTTKAVNSNDWNIFGEQVQYCLSEIVQEKCEIQFVPFIAYTVVGFNLMKALILLYTFLFVKENPLMTIGDAATSYLRQKDQSTAGLCLMGKSDLTWWHFPGDVAQTLRLKRKRWSSVVSRRRWTLVIIL